MTRKDVLNGVIDQILFHDINYSIEKEDGCESRRFLIKKKNGIGTYCNFNSASNLRKIQELFWICFHPESVCYEFDGSVPDKFCFTYIDLIERTVNYFQKLGIDFAFVRKICESKQVFRDLLLNAIINYILPTAFKRDILKSAKANPSDDITDDFNEALARIKDMIFRYRARRMIQTEGGDILQIRDCRYKDRECNFAPLLKVPFEYAFKNIIFSPAFFTLPLKQTEIRQRFQKQLEQEAKETEFDKLVRGFHRYPDDFRSANDTPWRSLDFEDESTEVRFPLSNTEVTRSELDFREFYYITHLDEQVIKEEYPQVTNHEELEKALQERAKADLEIHRRNCLIRYYMQVTKYIEDVLARMKKVEWEKLFRDDTPDETACRNALRAFSINDKYVFAVIQKNRSDVLWYTCYLFKEAIWQFVTSSMRDHRELGNAIRDYLSTKSELINHKNAIKDFLKSDWFKSAADEQETKIGHDGDPPQEQETAESIERFHAECEAYRNRVFSHVLADLRNVLTDYLNALSGK